MITSKHGPGPGAYTSIDATNVQGRYVVSSHKGSRAPKINPPKAGGNGLRMCKYLESLCIRSIES